MKPLDPSILTNKLDAEHLKVVQSFKKVLTGNVDMGIPTGNAPSSAGINAGVYTQFQKGNSTGVLIRIAGNGVAGTGAPYNWPAAGSLVINHGLLRQPIGFHIVDMDKDMRAYRTAAPDSNQITLTPTDNTASVTIYIF